MYAMCCNEYRRNIYKAISLVLIFYSHKANVALKTHCCQTCLPNTPILLMQFYFLVPMIFPTFAWRFTCHNS